MLFIIGQTATVPTLYQNVDRQKMNHWADSVFDAMSYDERISQLFMLVAEPNLSNRNMQKLMKYVKEMHVGGFLFQKGDPETQASVTNAIQENSHVPLMIALDGEWGLSMRLAGTTRFPKNMVLGAIRDNNAITEYGIEVARQCKEMGIHINFAPVMDVNVNADNPVIGNRSFGEDPKDVADKGTAYARGLESEGVLSVAKHFPGHGDTSEDSHRTLPTVNQSLAQMEKFEFIPFKQYIRGGFSGIMTAHLYVPALDSTPERPVSLSHAVVTDLLEKQMGFKGLRFTDALAMKGATENAKINPCVAALLAGNDILLAPANPLHDFEAVKAAIEDGTLDMEEIEAKCLKILKYKYIVGLNNYRPIKEKGLMERLTSPHAQWLSAHLNQEALTLLKNNSNIIPLKGIDRQKIAVLSIGESSGNAFQTMLNKFDTVACFSISINEKPATLKAIFKKLTDYDLIICGIHSTRIPESTLLTQLVARKNVILSFFTLPYYCKCYTKCISNAKAVVMAYEATHNAEEAAAQGIFGGIAINGQLPVTVPNLYADGTGIKTVKTRLGYEMPEEEKMISHRLDQIDSIAVEGLREGAYPGCEVLVARNGMVVYNKSFGYYDYGKTQPVTNRSVYDLASCSKATGTLLAVMDAYDKKMFTLNSQLGKLLPSLANSNKANITVRELLFHQSGLVPSIPFYMDAVDETQKNKDGSLIFKPSLISTKKKVGFTNQVARDMYISDRFQSFIVNDIRKSKLANRGTYVYSDLNFILLKMIVESKTGQPMDKMLAKDFFKKLGARHTTYNPRLVMDTALIVPTEDDHLVRNQLLRGYVHDEAAAFQGGVSGNAGLFSDADGLARILQLYLNLGTYGGERFYSQETGMLFTQTKSPVSRRGLGFDKPVVGNPKASPCGKLASESVYGHTGYTGTCFWVDPDKQLIYIFLSNRVNPTRENNKLSDLSIRSRIQDAIYKAIEK